MEELLENLKEALKENPDLVFEIPVKVETMSAEELNELFEKDKAENSDDTNDLE